MTTERDWESAAELLEVFANAMRGGEIHTANITIEAPPPEVVETWYGPTEFPLGREVKLKIEIEYGVTVSTNLEEDKPYNYDATEKMR